jgi:2-polyprenyl-3-methyl-5-hydroxy-6-metoxy-1,4-benzoquinol methylase
MNCRFCNATLHHVFVDLGMQPLANSYVVSKDQVDSSETYYTLKVRVCQQCLLAQLPELATAEQIFRDYAYLSSASSSWLEHARLFVDEMIARFQLVPEDLVIEIASNDGYLLQYFVQRGQTVLGIEPAINVAKLAERAGVPTVTRFFGLALAEELIREGKQAKLLVGNNVLAHVPNINDFVKGLHRVLASNGVISMEFPHVLNLIRRNQFDTIYHEHFSYLSFNVVTKILKSHGLRVFDVRKLSTHGGSLRVLACRDDDTRNTEASVEQLLAEESEAGLLQLETYTSFASSVHNLKWSLLELLIGLRREGKRIVGYGAPAKGNTLLNFCGIREDLLEYTVDRSPLKEGRLLPGTRIPVFAPDFIFEDKPDYVLILPWNIQSEIMEQMANIRNWGGKFIVPIPEPRILQ